MDLDHTAHSIHLEYMQQELYSPSEVTPDSLAVTDGLRVPTSPEGPSCKAEDSLHVETNKTNCHFSPEVWIQPQLPPPRAFHRFPNITLKVNLTNQMLLVVNLFLFYYF